MPLTTGQCAQFNDFLGRRPYDWAKKINKDRKPHSNVYLGMYKTETYPTFFGTTMLHERVYVTRPNDPGLWTQFTADPCVGTPCNTPRQRVSHGVDQLRFDRYRREYQTDVFCLDQLNTVEEGIQKIAAIVDGYKDLPEDIHSDFLRLLTVRKAGTAAQGAGLFLCGIKDSSGNPVAIDVTENMFTVNVSGGVGVTSNSLFVNLNANGQLTALGVTTTLGLQAAMGQLSMEFLNNFQEDLAGNGYHDRDWLIDGKFSITVDGTTARRLLVANPALTQMYSAADFAKGGAFYSYGFMAGCGDWMFKKDNTQMRFQFRGDLDGLNVQGGGALTNAVWIQQVQPFENVPATYGSKPQFSLNWKNAPIRLYHAYNRDARTVFVGDITSVNDEMKFGLARSFMGEWKWYSPDVIITTDPNTGLQCTLNNDKHNQGYWVGEFDLTEKTVYPEIERVILALGEPQPYVRVPTTTTPPVAPSTYQSLLAYNQLCGEYQPPGFVLPPED